VTAAAVAAISAPGVGVGQRAPVAPMAPVVGSSSVSTAARFKRGPSVSVVPVASGTVAGAGAGAGAQLLTKFLVLMMMLCWGLQSRDADRRGEASPEEIALSDRCMTAGASGGGLLGLDRLGERAILYADYGLKNGSAQILISKFREVDIIISQYFIQICERFGGRASIATRGYPEQRAHPVEYKKFFQPTA
jgi:hypothetical protein